MLCRILNFRPNFRLYFVRIFSTGDLFDQASRQASSLPKHNVRVVDHFFTFLRLVGPMHRINPPAYFFSDGRQCHRFVEDFCRKLKPLIIPKIQYGRS